MYKNFAFYYPITTKTADDTRKNGNRFDHVTDLLIMGVGNIKEGCTGSDSIRDKYNIHIDMIRFDKQGHYPILEVLNALESIESACYHHVHRMFMQYESDCRITNSFKEVSLAKVINLEMTRKVSCY